MADNSNDQDWVWCLVGNVVCCHEYGEDKEIRYGTKQFRPGAKVYMAPVNWGDGYEKTVVIGRPRNYKHYIEVVMHSKYTENYRIQKVYAPFVLNMMANSRHSWWDASEESERKIRNYIEVLNKRKEYDKTYAEGNHYEI